jgi:anti-sigma factor RsiW
MPISDTDLEMLETYLDGQLPLPLAEDLWRRLSQEPELSAEMDELRAQRAVRQAIWQSMEPDDVAADAMVRRVSSSIRSRRFMQQAQRWLTVAVAAAACVVVGFQLGWIEHGNGIIGASPAHGVQQVAQTPQAAHAYQVAIKDQNGNLIGTQRFDTQQDAVNFVNFLNTPQTAQSPTVTPMGRPNPGENIVPAADEQF